MITIRAARFPGDYPVAAAILNADNPAWPVTAADLEREDAARAPARPPLILLGFLDGAPAGLANALELGAGRFRIDLRVLPAQQGQGLGSALFAELLDRLAAQGARELGCEVWDGYTRAREFVERRGFTEAWRRIHLALDPRAAPPVPAQPDVVTLAERPLEPTLRQVWELDREVAADIPGGDPAPPVSFEQFRGLTLENPEFLPEACFLSFAAGQLAGFTYLTRGADGLFIEMTGVRRAARRRHLATRLKLAAIRYAQQQRAPSLRTINDSTNRAILDLNQKLGFVAAGAAVRYRKTIS